MEAWTDQNVDRRYPFADTATLQNGVDTIPDALLVDARVYSRNGSGRAYLSNITVEAGLVTITVSDGAVSGIASADVLATDRSAELVDTKGRPCGVLVFGHGLLEVAGWPRGAHPFNEEATPFCPRIQVPLSDDGVVALLAEQDGSDVSHAGDVWLVGENGVVLHVQNGYLRIDVTGDPLMLYRECRALGETALEELVKLFDAKALRTINGVGPDEYGEFRLVVGAENSEQQILRIHAVDGGIEISGAV